MAATKMSARRVCSAKFWVRLWQTVTVQLPGAPLRRSKSAIGVPTMELRPKMTACFPWVSMPALSSRDMMPMGVAGKKQGRSKDIFPALTG